MLQQSTDYSFTLNQLNNDIVNCYMKEYMAVRAEIVEFEKLLFKSLTSFSSIVIALVSIAFAVFEFSESNGISNMNINNIMYKSIFIRFIFYIVPVLNSILILSASQISFTIWKASLYISHDLYSKIKKVYPEFTGFGWENLQGDSRVMMLANGIPICLGTTFITAISAVLLHASFHASTLFDINEHIIWYISCALSAFSLVYSLVYLAISIVKHPSTR